MSWPANNRPFNIRIMILFGLVIVSFFQSCHIVILVLTWTSTLHLLASSRKTTWHVLSLSSTGPVHNSSLTNPLAKTAGSRQLRIPRHSCHFEGGQLSPPAPCRGDDTVKIRISRLIAIFYFVWGEETHWKLWEIVEILNQIQLLKCNISTRTPKWTG